MSVNWTRIFSDGDEQRRYTALHHQLVASAKAVKMAHEIAPDNQVGCMLLSRVSYPYTCRPEDVLKAQQVMQTANYYCGDVHVREEYPAFAGRLWREKGITIPFAEGDREALKEGRVDFVSFSYYSSSTATDDPTVPVANGNMMRGPANPYLEQSQWGWTIDPKGLRYLLNEFYGRWKRTGVSMTNIASHICGSISKRWRKLSQDSEDCARNKLGKGKQTYNKFNPKRRNCLHVGKGAYLQR